MNGYACSILNYTKKKRTAHLYLSYRLGSVRKFDDEDDKAKNFCGNRPSLSLAILHTYPKNYSHLFSN